jgi:hypothetical protein
MKRPVLADAELPLRLRATRHSRRELEKLLARAKRAIEAFAASDDTGLPREKADAAQPRHTRLLPSAVG